jgi:hypothetical protein
MKSCTAEEAHQYWAPTDRSVRLNEDCELYLQSTLPRIVVQAPTEIREAIIFVTTLVEATRSDAFQGGFVWFRIFHVGVLNSYPLGWKTLESIRIAGGDTRTLELAPAQIFDAHDETELKLFLLQSMLFGWNILFLPEGLDCGIQSTSSHRWFFYADRQIDLDKIFEAFQRWSPIYETN